MPNYSVSVCDQKQFNGADFTIDDHSGRKHLEGRFYFYRYDLDRGAEKPGALQILRNIQNAIKSLGGSVVWEHYANTTLKLVRDGREVWISAPVSSNASYYEITMVEAEAMKQDVVANAAALSAGIKGEGRIAVYGIHFDSGKADIKPESAAALTEIVKLLQQNAALKLHVVGHTDNTGSAATNRALSEARAAAVVKALVAQGIATTRLDAFGAGPYCPVASNGTEDGKAKNRRVELVEQ